MLPVLALLAAGPVAATTYYVRAAGNDAADGLSPATALASIRPAARMLREPGDRLIVGPGVYYEGNIAPFGNGTPDAPIVLVGDASGAATGDAPGPVLILSPNTPSATSGFYIRGRNDIVVEGFTIYGAKDAGIDVRGRRRTGVDSTRIAIRNNTVSASRRGIQIAASGGIDLTGNHIIGTNPKTPGSAGDGIVLVGATSGPMRPNISSNVIEDCFIGIIGSGLADALIADNEVRTLARNLMFYSNYSLAFTGNRLLGPNRGGVVFGTFVSVTDNMIQTRASFAASESLEVLRNTVTSNLSLRGPGSRAHVADNMLADVFAGGIGELTFERNDAHFVEAKGVQKLTAAGNRVVREMILRTTMAAEATENTAAAMKVRGIDLLVQQNTVIGAFDLSADTATVVRNNGASLSIRRRHIARAVPLPDTGETGFLVEGNYLNGSLRAAGVRTIVVQGNRAAGLLKAVADREIYASRNDAAGVACRLTGTDSRATLVENRSTHSLGAALQVIGADRATIENNYASNSADSGLAVRQAVRLTVTGNEFVSNPSGGISVRSPLVGDCNDNVDVTIDELLTAVGIALQSRPLHDCDAADVDRDQIVTVGEIVRSVQSALEGLHADGSLVEIRDNHVEDNGRFGIDVYAIGPVQALDNRVLRNGGVPIAVHGRGLPSDTAIVANLLGLGGAEGLVLEGVAGARIDSNVLVSNHDAGILLRDAPAASVVNNLVYANGSHGIALGIGARRPARDAVVMNNTIYANGGWGITIGNLDIPSTGAAIRNNILQHNLAGGIAVAAASLPGLTTEYNINQDGYGDRVLPGATDLAVDPQFVAPGGSDEIVGGEGYADDDFHVPPTSAAIDAGSAPAIELGISGSVVAGQTDDRGIVDIGYHYGAGHW